MKAFFHEFKEFAIKGNLLDLAVGIIIGTAFSKIVSSFVSDIIMPLIGFAIGNANFVDHFWVLSGGGPYATLEQAKEAGAVTINYGVLLTNAIDFLILAFILFIFVKQINRFRRKQQK